MSSVPVWRNVLVRVRVLCGVTGCRAFFDADAGTDQVSGETPLHTPEDWRTATVSYTEGPEFDVYLCPAHTRVDVEGIRLNPRI